MARIPFNWREDLPKKGWKIFSETPTTGRREVIIHAERGRLLFRCVPLHGKESGSNRKLGGERLLTPEQHIEAVNYANMLWANDPVFGGAHRTRIKDMVTLVLADGDYFKAFSSVHPEDELHKFNNLLWTWIGDDKVLKK